MPPGLGHRPNPPQRGQQITSRFLTDVADSIGRLNQISFPNGMIAAGGAYVGNDQSPAAPLWNNNVGPDTCPAYGCVKVNGGHPDSARNIPLVYGARPSTYGSQYSHRFNGEWDVDEGAWGEVQQGPDFIALYKPGDYTGTAPVLNEMLGPRSDSWELRKNTFGYQVVELINTTSDFLVRVQRVPFTDFRGFANADIASHAVGTVSICYRSDATTYTDTGIDTPSNVVFNALDVTIKNNALLECKFDPYFAGGVWNEGWRIVQADFTC